MFNCSLVGFNPSSQTLSLKAEGSEFLLQEEGRVFTGFKFNQNDNTFEIFTYNSDVHEVIITAEDINSDASVCLIF